MAADVAPVFRLPNIEFIHLAMCRFDEGEGDSHVLLPECSTVKEFGFNARSLQEEEVTKFLASPSSLEKLMWTYSSAGDADVIALASLHQKNSLRVLCIESHMYAPEALVCLPNLRIIENIDTTLLVRPADDASDSASTVAASSESLQNTPTSCLRSILPQSIERSTLSNHLLLNDTAADQHRILESLMQLVEDDDCLHLKEICLFEVMSLALND